MLGELKKAFSIKPAKKTTVKRWYQQPPSICQYLPWMEYDGYQKVFLLEDGVSVAAMFECGLVATDAKGERFLEQLQLGLQGVFQDVFPGYFADESPWVVQFYLQDELSLLPLMQAYGDYIRGDVKETQFTKNYRKLFAEHLDLLTQPQGLFIDDKVTGKPFAGRIRKVRAVIYRRLHAKSKQRKNKNAIADLNIIADSFQSKLESQGVSIKRMNGEDFYRWMVQWFNPAPKQANKSTDMLLQRFPYPGDEHMPFGYDFSEKLFYSIPKSNQDEGTWYFDDKPHKYMSIAGINQLPKTGHVSMSRQFGNHSHALFDSCPPGSVFVLTVVLLSQQAVLNHIDSIERSTRKATSTEGLMAKEDCETARRAIHSGNYFFPTSMGVYLRGDCPDDLEQKEMQVRVAMGNNGLITIDGEDELTPVDSYLRYLPANYHYTFDKNYLSRSRYITGKQLSQLLPFYGQERGTGHIGLPLFNRSGEPLTVDPFNPDDKDNNSHLLLLGTTGSGKSALSAYLMMHMMATYRPRLVIIDAGNSFRLLGEYFKSQGLSVNRVEIAMDKPVSLNPFSDSQKMLSQVNDLDKFKLEQLAKTSEEEYESLKEQATTSEQENQENRDYLGEMLLSALLMITGGEAKEEAKISRQDRLLVIDALIQCAKAKEGQMLPEDLAFTLESMAKLYEKDEQLSHQQKAIRLQEMADGIKIFCQDALSARFFNRPGEPWQDADVTILEMGLFKEDGYEAQRALAFMGAMNKTMSLSEANQYDDRFTLFFADECHIVTRNPLTAASITKCSKMSRKIGLWLWLATQNVEDFPDEARKLLSMMEFWIGLGMSEAEIKEIERFRRLTDEERELFRSVRKAKGKYVEGVLLCTRFKALFRNIPPRLCLALAMTEQNEKAERQKIMQEYHCTEVDAAMRIAANMIMKVVA